MEILWKELIIFNQNNESNINIFAIISNFLKNGEYFQFLDGTNFTIEKSFFIKLFSFLENSGQEKIAILSIMG
jgi:hypothetical protein